MSAQTLVWTNDELLRYIFSYLTVSCSGAAGIDRSTLRRCAEVSRVFSEVAIDLLWKDLYNLSNLTKMLPSFCCNQMEPGDSRALMVVRTGGPILDSEWSRFAFYARRIRTLGYSDSFAPLHPDVVAAIAQYAAPEAALPRLKSFTWELSNVAPCFALADLVPSCLRSFTMRCRNHTNTPAHVNLTASWRTAMSLASRCPDLTRLEVTTWNYRHCVPLSLTGPLPSCLQELSLELYGDHALHLVWNLDCLPSIKTVSLTSQPPGPAGCQCTISSIPASSGDFLRHVKTLTLSMSIATATRILTATTSQALEYLRLDLNMRRNTDLLSSASVFATSLQRFSSNLQNLLLSFRRDDEPVGIQTAMHSLTALLDPLLSFHALIVLEVRLSGVSGYLSTQDLWSMARSWPRITRLHIQDSDIIIEDVEQLTTVPVPALLAFATHCPSLEHLVIDSLYITRAGCALESWRPSSAESVSAPRLRVLEINIVPCPGENVHSKESEAQMRPFLEATFPNAKFTFHYWRTELLGRRNQTPDEVL